MPRQRRPLVPSSTLKATYTDNTTASEASVDLQICVYDEPRRGCTHFSTHNQPPITIVPLSDSDAYIVDKVVTPFDVSDEDRAVRRVLNYVVGWPDRPYARLLVPCNKVLDYVSPRTLEDYEYSITLQQHAGEESVTKTKPSDRRNPAEQASTTAIERERPVHRLSAANAEVPIPLPKPLAGPRGPWRKRRSRKRAIRTTETAPASTTPPVPRISEHSSDHLIVQNIPSAIISGDRRTGFSLKLKRQFENYPEPTTESSIDDGDIDGLSLAIITPDTNLTEGMNLPELDWKLGDFRSKTIDPDDRDGILLGEKRNYVIDGTVEGGPQISGYTFTQQTKEAYPSQIAAPKVTPVLPPKVVGMPYSPLGKNEYPIAGKISTVPKQEFERFKMPDNVLEPRSTDDDNEEDNDLYEVDRLENDAFYGVDERGNYEGDEESRPVGEGTRFFLVRWKGNWPPDQNPTWEPAENLPPKMVRQYLKKTYGRVSNVHMDDSVPASLI